MTHGSQVTVIEYRVPYADTDQMGVVYYANHFEYFERVRNELLRSSQFTYLEMEAKGLQLPVVEAHCEYKRPAHYDDLLHISGRFLELGASRVKIGCEIHREQTLLAAGYTVHACMAAATGRLTRLPTELRRLVDAQDD